MLTFAFSVSLCELGRDQQRIKKKLGIVIVFLKKMMFSGSTFNSLHHFQNS